MSDTISGWVKSYRNYKTRLYRCLICGAVTNNEQKYLCKDRYCKLTLKVVAQKVITDHYDSYIRGENYIQYNRRTGAWNSDKPHKYFWWVFPDRHIVDEKIKEIVSKDFLLDKLSEVEFIRLFQAVRNPSFCNPCQLKFNRISYEKYNSILIT